MLEHSYYSVISPEGCAAILWKDRAFADKAAEALNLTAQHLLKLELADGIIAEPEGGAHSDPEQMAETLKTHLCKTLDELGKIPSDKLKQQRYDKFRAMGNFTSTEREEENE